MNFVSIPSQDGLPDPACEPTYVTEARDYRPPSGSVSVQDLSAALEAPPGATLVDVREHIEFQGGRVPGAHLLPMSELATRHDELRALDAPVYLICQTGSRSETCRQWLAERGHDVINVAGGTSAWRRAGYALEA